MTGVVAVREERPGDAAAIRALVGDAFRAVAHARGTEASIVDALRDAGALALSLVAEEGGAVVGHVAFSPVTIDHALRGWFGLGPVAVRPDRQRRGIGQALVREALQRLQASGAAGCVVLGDPAYYGRFGFRADPRLRYPGPPPVYFQALAFGGEVPEGEVAFHDAFSAAPD